MQQPHSISIVIAALNEAASLESAVLCARQAAREQFDDYEIIIVDDGSRDRTGEIADHLADQDPSISVIHHPRPRNLGGAFKAGLERATMTYVTACQGKGGNTVEDLAQIWSHVGQADVIIPYTSNMQDRSRVRRMVSRAFTALMNRLSGLRLRYYMHFVVYPRRLVQGIDIRTSSYAFQPEVIVKLLRRGATFLEVAVRDDFTQARRTRVFRLRNIWGVVQCIFWMIVDVRLTPRHTRKDSEGGDQ